MLSAYPANESEHTTLLGLQLDRIPEISNRSAAGSGVGVRGGGASSRHATSRRAASRHVTRVATGRVTSRGAAYSRCVRVQRRRVGARQHVREGRRGVAGRPGAQHGYMQNTLGMRLPASLRGARREHERRRGRCGRRRAQPRPRHAGHPQPCAHSAPQTPVSRGP
ncbi:unnamed protein product, partial [Iphiclides podalirius]